MRVADWNKWTRFKKRLVLVFFVLGALLGLGIENSDSMTGGFIGLVLMFWGAVLISTIRESEW